MVLALSLPLQPAESALSYLSRLARRNHCARVQDFASDMGMSWDGLVRNVPSEFEQLSNLLGIDIGALTQNTFTRRPDGLFVLQGHALSRMAIHRNIVQACPVCLIADRKGNMDKKLSADEKHNLDQKDGVSERAVPRLYAPYIRTHWLLRSIRCCTNHRCMLITLNNTTPQIHAMDYDHIIRQNWARIEAVGLGDIDHAISDDALKFTIYIEKRLARSHSKNIWLDRLDIDIAAKFCEFLGVLVAFGPKPDLDGLNEQEWLEVGAIGFAIAAQGLGAVSDVYESLRDDTVPLNQCGYTRALGFFYRWLARQDEPRVYAIQRHLHDYICNHYPVPSGALVAGISNPKRRVHSWPSKAVEIGIGESSAYRLRAEICHNPSHYRTFPAHGYADAFELLATGLKRYHAAKYLGISIEVFDSLVAATHIPIAMEFEASGQFFRQSDLDAFVGRLRARATGAPADSRDLPLLRACKETKVSLANAVKLIIAGALEASVPDDRATNLNTFLVDKHALIKCFDALISDRKDEISVDQLAKMLCIDRPSAGYLVAEGYIFAHSIRNPRNGMYRKVIKPSSIEAFKRDYITLGQMAKHAKKQVRSIKCDLASLGVTSVPAIKTTSRIYHRARIPDKYLPN